MRARPDRFSPTVNGWLAVLFLGIFPGAVQADALIAVAANFASTARTLEALFAEQSGQRVSFSVAATGKLYAQIRAGAPFDVLLAADAERPARLEQEGLAVPGSRRTYALGRLGFWVPAATRPVGADAVSDLPLRHIAIANPRLAPYGLAARETLDSLGVLERVAGRLVFGQDVGEAFALVASGAADAGFVARAQLQSIATDRVVWWVPAELHAPIRQDLVLLQRGANNAAARAFVEFLATPAAVAAIRASGFDTPSS
ncbi:MAG: molybdate ABC transporter substrate-binding protein [Pseudomonadales bacterium]